MCSGRGHYKESKPSEGNRVNNEFTRNRAPQVGKGSQKEIAKKNQIKDQETAQTFLIKAPSLESNFLIYIAIPGTGFRAGIGTGPLGVMALGFMGLGPGAGPRRGLPAWLAELDRGRPPIWGGGAIWGPPPYGPGDMERGGPA